MKNTYNQDTRAQENERGHGCKSKLALAVLACAIPFLGLTQGCGTLSNLSHGYITAQEPYAPALDKGWENIRDPDKTPSLMFSK